MQETLNVFSVVAGWFGELIKHSSFVSVLLSLFGGWGFSVFFSFPIHRAIKDDELATWCARAACVLASFWITAGTWPNEFRWSWAFTMAFMSPILGLIALKILSKYQPEVATWLGMRKISPPPQPPYGP